MTMMLMKYCNILQCMSDSVSGSIESPCLGGQSYRATELGTLSLLDQVRSIAKPAPFQVSRVDLKLARLMDIYVVAHHICS